MGTYDTAQICRNGHVINSMASRHPEDDQRFCDRCGEPAIMRCESCQLYIRGEYIDDNLGPLGYYTAPAYCYDCGSAFPWTEAHLSAAKELAESFEELSEDERKELGRSDPGNTSLEGCRVPI